MQRSNSTVDNFCERFNYIWNKRTSMAKKHE